MRCLILISMVIVILSLSGSAMAMQTQASEEDYRRLAVKPRPGVPEAARGETERALGLTREGRVLGGIEILRTPGGVAGKAAAAALARTGRYEYVEPDLVFRIAAAPPDDTYFSLQWGLSNADYPGTDIGILNAWDTSQGNGAVVAVLDSGERHLYDLPQTRWTNPGELANGLDDDGNGFADDLYGWNFWNGTNDVSQGTVSHGTHVGGIVSAATNNGTGVAGVAPQAKRMVLKMCDDPYCSISAALYSIDYASRMGARVINASWGGYFTSSALRDAVAAFTAAGGVFVAAAGNDGQNIDTYLVNGHSFCPACLAKDVPGVVAVASIDKPGNLSSFSNYGPQTVLLAAPGGSIASTYPDTGYAYMSGTSMAAPHLAGTAALMIAAKPAAGVDEIVNALRASAKPRASLDGKVASGGLLDANGALASLLTSPPPPGPAPDTSPPVLAVPAGITAEAVSPEGATVNYTATATDDTDPNPVVACSPASGSVFPLGATTVNCTAVDAAGNSASGSFAVTVLADTSPPGEVGNLTALPGDGSVTLVWTDPGDSDLAKMLVSWGVVARNGSVSYGNPVEVAPGTQTIKISGERDNL